MPRRPRRLSGRRARAALRPLAILAPAVAVILDFDGSLAPVVDDPADAVARPEAIAALRRLVGRVEPIVVLSGRPVAFLRRAVPVPGVTLIGQYGLEQEGPGTTTIVDPRVAAVWGATSVAEIAARASAELPGVRVEEKGQVALALHWRERPDLGSRAEVWGREVAQAAGLIAVPGRRVLELRPDLPVDKGRALRQLVADRARPPRGLLVAGDDHGDLPAFDAARHLVEDGTLEVVRRVGVHSPEAPPDLADRTDLMVAGPHGLSELLEVLEGLTRTSA